MPLTFTLPSYAKINWFLRILGKRADDYHELCTVFQTVSLHDEISFSESREIYLTCSNEKIPIDESNLIIKVALTLKEKFNIKEGARIHLEKNIPAPGGLGGGSSNAAVALIGLRKLWKIDIDLEELTILGNESGSDIAFFFVGGTALGTGRGTDLEQLEDLINEHILIVTPDAEIPTGKAFSLLNAPRLTKNDSKSILKICRNDAQALYLRQTNPVNDFEKAVFKIEPEVERAKKKLLSLGAKSSLMSGSGASVFAVFENRDTFQNAFEVLIKYEKDWKTFITKTISHFDYKKSLNI